MDGHIARRASGSARSAADRQIEVALIVIQIESEKHASETEAREESQDEKAQNENSTSIDGNTA